MSEGELKPSSFDFGTLVAFVAPGFLAVCAVAYDRPWARSWLQAAAEKEQNVGTFLFVALASLAVGLVVSGTRQLTIDKILASKLMRGYRVQLPDISWGQLDEKALRALVTVRDEYYRYYQFYGNTLISSLLLLIMAFRSGDVTINWTLVLIVAPLVALALSARYSLYRYGMGVNSIINKGV